MKHKEIEKLIQKSLDREINRAEQHKLEEHLAQCPHCRQFSQQMVQVNRGLNRLTEFYPRSDFNARVLAKLGFKRRFAWARAGMVFAGSWVAAVLFFAYSSLPEQIFSHIATSIPAAMRFFDQVGLVIASLTQVLSPAVKSSLSSLNPVVGLVFSIVFIYFLGRALQKEVKCKA
ncbi:MAG: zf-HC2 domain-containing protein [candidate division WOR-3 bacterium]